MKPNLSDIDRDALEPRDSFVRFMDLCAFIGAPVVVLIVVALIYALVGNFDYADALTAEATAKEARATSAGEPKLAFPIPYDATVTQPDDKGLPRTRYYVRSDK